MTKFLAVDTSFLELLTGGASAKKTVRAGCDRKDP